MFSKIKILFVFVFMIGIMSIPATSRAIEEMGPLDEDIYVKTFPENPKPNDSVTIKITSYATDLNKAFIEWRSGSNLIMSGYGEISYSFQVMGANTSTVVDVFITPDGSVGQISKRIIISPTEIEILWEAVDGYTPPFYKGKTFGSAEGIFKVVAVPNTNFKTGSSVVYKWKEGDSTLQDFSGYGKNYYVFGNNVLDINEKISVSASSVDGKYNATNEIEIPIVTPKIIFYKKSPTEGVLYNKALIDNSFFQEDEFTIVAEPYFLSTKDKWEDFTYNWKINGGKINTPSKKTEITIRPTEKGGYATINLVIENLSTLFQKVTGQLKINM